MKSTSACTSTRFGGSLASFWPIGPPCRQTPLPSTFTSNDHSVKTPLPLILWVMTPAPSPGVAASLPVLIAISETFSSAVGLPWILTVLLPLIRSLALTMFT